MAFNTKITCNRCTTCCVEPIVPVTNKDVKRIISLTGEKVKSVVRFYTPSEMEFDRDSDVWINFSYGRRAMGLRKKNNRCKYLNEEGLCSVYDFRPMTCRTFPYQPEYNDDSGEMESFSVNEAVKCQSTVKKSPTPEDVFVVVDKEEDEDFAYFALIRKWNKSHQGGAQEFLEYIGLI